MNILKDTSSNGTRVAGIGVKDLDDFLNGDGLVAGSPSVKVCGSADEGVTKHCTQKIAHLVEKVK